MTNYLLHDQNSMYYECGFSCDNALFIRLGSESFFITDPRYTLEAQENSFGVLVIEAYDLFASAKELLKKNHITHLIFDPKELSFFQYQSLQDSSYELIATVDFSKHKRIIKSDQEIACLQKASLCAKEKFILLGDWVKEREGMCSELEIFSQAKQILSQGGKFDLSFEPIVAINENAAKPHARATTKVLSQGDLLLIDAGLKYERYCSDRTVTLGDDFVISDRAQFFSKPLWQKVYDTVRKAHEETINAITSGMCGREIDYIAREIIDKAGFAEYFVHSTGHGVGLDIHEFPAISQKSDTKIEDGMVFTIEPGIYLPNQIGVRIEDMVVMKNGRAQIL